MIGDRSAVVGVLALQGDVREHLAALTTCGVRAIPVRRSSEIENVDALVIPGGESTTIYNLSVVFEVFDRITALILDGMPVYGSCAGMIMISSSILDGRSDQRSFGGIDMTVRRNAFGRQIDSFEMPVTMEGISGGTFPAVFIRAPWVERVGPGVQVLGRVHGQTAGSGSDHGDGRIVAVRQGSLLATAFHPELSGDLRVHRYFVEMVRKAIGEHTTEE